jgi:hypothetical protein
VTEDRSREACNKQDITEGKRIHPNSVHLSLGQKQYVLNRLEEEEQKCSCCGSAGWGFATSSRRPRGAKRYMVHLKCEECGTPICYPVEGPIPT